MPRRRSRMHHTATGVFRLVAGLRVGVAGVVLELVGCGTRSARGESEGEGRVDIQPIAMTWNELTPYPITAATSVG
ncbi:hypothetical protein BT67DRAFT_442989 [Trichocladium antarcticum]|uniref:Uncharacterized protein n=1 Tax=Trichocladium antarcticum TaxID=1450529 RepID=A0AAN6UIC8_9PEZI|nr:hypothetical protein BT67DRAFT_442989 [Trichocladium antarcticum]